MATSPCNQVSSVGRSCSGDVSCWSVKGGSGTTVVAAAVGVTCAAERTEGVLLVDLAGDLPAALGLDGTFVARGARLARREHRRLGRRSRPRSTRWRASRWWSTSGSRSCPRGTASAAGDARRVPELLARLRADGRTVICDCGNLALDDDPAAVAVAAGATRRCWSPGAATWRSAESPEASVCPTGVVVVTERGRSLRPDDVAEVVGVPVVAEVVHDPQLARVVDAGLLVGRLDRSTRRALAGVLDR